MITMKKALCYSTSILSCGKIESNWEEIKLQAEDTFSKDVVTEDVISKVLTTIII